MRWAIVIQQDAGCCFVSAKIVATVSKSLDTCCILLQLAMHAHATKTLYLKRRRKKWYSMHFKELAV